MVMTMAQSEAQVNDDYKTFKKNSHVRWLSLSSKMKKMSCREVMYLRHPEDSRNGLEGRECRNVLGMLILLCKTAFHAFSIVLGGQDLRPHLSQCFPFLTRPKSC